MDELIELVDTTELNAMVIDIKNDDGRVTYKMDPDCPLSSMYKLQFLHLWLREAR